MGSEKSGIVANSWKKLFIYLLLVSYEGNVGSMFFPEYPDALACTSEFVLNVYATTVYFWHAGGMYCQVYAL